jgi:hypothetical protein
MTRHRPGWQAREAERIDRMQIRKNGWYWSLRAYFAGWPPPGKHWWSR